MNNGKEQAAPASSPTPERIHTIQNLFTAASSTLSKALQDDYMDLLVPDRDRILERVEASLDSYGGELTAAEFNEWACNFVRGETKNHRFLNEVLAEHTRIIFAGIRSALGGSSEDLSVEQCDLFNEVVMLAFKMAPALSKPGPAKLSSRLYALARLHVLSYHTTKRNNRLRLVTERASEISAEHVTTSAEIAETQWRPPIDNDAQGYVFCR